MNINGYFGPEMVKECIIQESKRKVILKFNDGDVQVAIAEPEDEFNPETGILWATMKHIMHKYGCCSAYSYVEECLKKNKDRQERKNRRKEKNNPETGGYNGTTSSKCKERDKRFVFDDCEEEDFDSEGWCVLDIEAREIIPSRTIYCHPSMLSSLISLFGKYYTK